MFWSRITLIIIDGILVNAAFLCAYLIRYGWPFPKRNFSPYTDSLIFLTAIQLVTLFLFGAFRQKFRSSWQLFKKLLAALFVGTLLCVAFVYVYRIEWHAFPTGVFVLSFPLSFFFIFQTNKIFLKSKRQIRKNVVVIGKDNVDDIIFRKGAINKIEVAEINDIPDNLYIDQLVICGKIKNQADLSMLTYLINKYNVNVVFSPSVYMELLHEKINGHNSFHFLSTFVGRQTDFDEFLIRSIDVTGSIALLILLWPVMLILAAFIKLGSKGPVLFKQKRVGKDGKMFYLYKFRTMVQNAEELLGPVWASPDDPRVTKFGKYLRKTRIDELPQILNVLKGDMSLVGPRPERPHFVKKHKALREIRLAVKPGITGLAQIRKLYDLKPQHKIKYDYLYIQQRSPLLNFYIILKTFPIVFSRSGW